jgi:hypothetical protein
MPVAPAIMKAWSAQMHLERLTMSVEGMAKIFEGITSQIPASEACFEGTHEDFGCKTERSGTIA